MPGTPGRLTVAASLRDAESRKCEEIQVAGRLADASLSWRCTRGRFQVAQQRNFVAG